MRKPLVIDLYCGLGGWAEGFLAEGYDVIGFDIEQRPYPGQLVLQDVLTLDGAQLAQLPNLAAIVASSPCQKYSYMAMPWKRAKELAAWYRADSARIVELNALFNASFRIQREASDEAGWEIPLVAENVKGAQPWVGRARANFGSFYLWGDVDSIGGRIVRRGDIRFGMPTVKAAMRGQKFNPDGTAYGQGSWFAIADSKNRGVNGQKGRSNFHFFEETGLPSPSFHGAEHEVSVQRAAAIKNKGDSWFNVAHNTESGVGNNPDGRKGKGGGWFSDPGEDGTRPHWKDSACITRTFNSKSPARKIASAEIAKIPFPLAQHIASVFKPSTHNNISRLKQPPRSQTTSTTAAGRTNP